MKFYKVFLFLIIYGSFLHSAEVANEEFSKRLNKRFESTDIYSAYADEELALHLKIISLKCQRFCNYLCCRKSAHIQERLQIAELELVKVEWLYYPDARKGSRYPMHYCDLRKNKLRQNYY